MSLRTKVLASQINNLSDARYFSAFPVEWLSFTGNPESSAYLSTNSVNEIIGWVTGPKVVLDARGCTSIQIQDFLEHVQVGAIIIDSQQELATEFEEHYDIMRVVTIPVNADLTALEAEVQQVLHCEFIIYDFQTYGVNASTILHPEFSVLLNKKPSIVYADFSIKEIPLFLESGAQGLMISSGEEEKVGLRSFEDIQDLFEELELDEDELNNH